MKNNRLIRLFNILDTTEKRKLRQLVEISGKDNDMLVLYNYLIKHVAKPKQLDKEQVFRAVYPAGASFNSRKLSDLNTQLYHLAEDFFIAQYIKQKGRLIQRRLLILEGLNEKALSDDRYIDHSNHLTKKIINDLQNSLKRTDVHDLSYYLNKYQLYSHLYYFDTNKWENGHRHLEALIENLDTFYCLAKLQYANELFMRKKIVNENSRVLLLDELCRHSILLGEKGVWRADIYRLSLELIQGFDKEKFRRLKEQTFEHADELNKTELSDILVFLANHASQATRQNKANLVVDNYEIIQLGLEKEVFIEKGLIPPLLLINYAFLSSEVGRAGEIESMLVLYRDRISDSERENTFLLCEAYGHFGNREFYKAYRLVNDHSRRPVAFSLHQKPLELMCLYELENAPAQINTDRTLYETCETYRRNLDRRAAQISPVAREANRNFIKILLKLNVPDVNKEELMQIIDNEPVTCRSWLSQKITVNYRNP